MLCDSKPKAYISVTFTLWCFCLRFNPINCPSINLFSVCVFPDVLHMQGEHSSTELHISITALFKKITLLVKMKTLQNRKNVKQSIEVHTLRIGVLFIISDFPVYLFCSCLLFEFNMNIVQ